MQAATAIVNRILRSPHADVHIPDVSLTAYVLRDARAHGEKTALVCGVSGERYTYREFADAVDRAAAGFYSRGVRKGDVIGIVSPNTPSFAVAFLALASIGAVTSPVNPSHTSFEIAAQFTDSHASMVLTIPALVEKCRDVQRQVASIGEIIVFGNAPGTVPFADILACMDAVPNVPIDAANDLVALPYSSGTAGLPKGVMLTHRNLVANLCQTFGPGAVLGDTDRMLAVLPFHHIYGLVVIMNGALCNGATLVTLPRFELESFMQTIEMHRITYVNVVPPIIVALGKNPAVEGYDLSSLQHIHCGAAPLGKELAMSCATRIGCTIRQGYGLTETSPVTHSHPHNEGIVKYGSVGPPIANTECRLIDVETGTDVVAGERGELWVRGPQVMRGYLNNPAATSAVLTADGWFKTGDVAVADSDGWFAIVDRVKELIKYKGMQVAPAELEAILLSHSLIADAAVIPFADDVAGEIPKAFVVQQGVISGDEVMDYVAARVAPHKRVRAVEFIDSIPRSASGKILRRVLREREVERTLQRVQT